MSHVVMICMLLFIVIAEARAATLTVAFDTPGISISAAERNILLQRVAAIKDTDIKLAEMSETASADILLTTRSSLTGWQYSQISLGYIPSLIALSVQPHDTLSLLNVAQLARGYTLTGRDVHTLPLNSNVLSLLQAKRYDVIVEQSSGVFQHDMKSQLYRRNLYPGRPIRLATKTLALKEDLEQRASQHNIQGVKLLDESVRAITVQLIAKSFNAEKYLLQESAEDLGFLALLQQKLPQFSLSSVTTSSADAMAALQQATPACIVNYSKKDDQTELIYSLPTQVYLGPRLYVAKNNPLAGYLKLTAKSDAALSFERIFNQLPNIRFASLESLRKDITAPGSNGGQHQFLPLLRFETAFSLLQRGRVDALWIYPVMFRFSLDDMTQANNFVSFVLRETGTMLPVYLACNNSNDTRELVAQLDQLLLDKDFYQALLQQNALGLTNSDSHDYAVQYQQALNNAAKHADAKAAGADRQ